ncbi:MAG TPA: phosphatase PAP2 family protein [Caulobacteraceae bacterium]
MTISEIGRPALLASLIWAAAVACAPAMAVAETPVASVVAGIDPATLLPAPPTRGSGRERDELGELRALMASRAPDALASARWDDAHEDPSAFAAVLAPTYDLKALPQTVHLLDLAQDTGDAVVARAKTRFRRLRPFRIDPTINGCPTESIGAYSSYPSGTAAFGWVVATVLSDLAPEKAEALRARAEAYGHNRMVCGMHFRSDVEAAKIIGVAVGRDLMAAPELQSQIAAARAEMAAARAVRAAR